MGYKSNILGYKSNKSLSTCTSANKIVYKSNISSYKSNKSPALAQVPKIPTLKEGEPMNINNFDQHFNQVILQRGYQYYMAGNIVDVAQINESNWQAEVEGTQLYVVDITIDAYKKITYMDCDCPYERDCKHIAATLYAIREEMHNPPSKKIPLKQLLQGQTKEQLIDMIIGVGKNHPAFLQEIEFQVTPIENELAVAEKLILHHIKMAKDPRKRFIGWNKTAEAMEGIYLTQERIQSYIDNEEYLIAVQLATLCFRHAFEAMEYSDDSSGDIGGAVEDSVALIDQVISRGVDFWTQHEREEVFSMIRLEAMNPDLDGWTDWRMGLLHTCIPLCADDGIEKKFQALLQSLAENGDSWSAQYVNKEIKELQFKILTLKHSDEAIEQFLQQNLEDDNIRERLILAAIQKRDYEKVLELTTDGLQHDAKHRGIVTKWRNYAFEAHKSLGHKEEMRKLAKQLLIGGDMSYLAELKQLYTEQQWLLEREQLLDDVKQTNGHIYAGLIVEELQTLRILAYCKESPNRIEHYYPYIKEHYYEDVCALFIDFINSKAFNAIDRKRYQDVCRSIQTMRKAGYKIEANHLIADLLQSYAKRPAFVDELRKIL